MAEPGQGFFPGRAAIEAYGDGGFRFAGMSHRGSIICLPSGIHAWETPTIDAAGLDLVLSGAEPLDFVLIGTGRDIQPLTDGLRWMFRGRGIQVDAMTTGAAVRTYNVLLAEDRRVAAVLKAID